MYGHNMARREDGEFLLRMEDTDLQRSKPEWDALIREDLTWLGLDWDGPVHRQSEHLEEYEARMEPLIEDGLVYPCRCTRSDIRAAAAPQEGVAHDVYPGTCRGRTLKDRKPGDALRLDLTRALESLNPKELTFTETGPSRAGVHIVDRETELREIGDVVLLRKGEGIVAYFLASAVDDAAQAITHVVRGEDLFDFTAIQVILMRLLDLTVPTYHHHRLVRDENGKRLAKRDDARAISKFREDGATPDDIRRMVDL